MQIKKWWSFYLCVHSLFVAFKLHWWKKLSFSGFISFNYCTGIFIFKFCTEDVLTFIFNSFLQLLFLLNLLCIFFLFYQIKNCKNIFIDKLAGINHELNVLITQILYDFRLSQVIFLIAHANIFLYVTKFFIIWVWKLVFLNPLQKVYWIFQSIYCYNNRFYWIYSAISLRSILQFI